MGLVKDGPLVKWLPLWEFSFLTRGRLLNEILYKSHILGQRVDIMERILSYSGSPATREPEDSEWIWVGKQTQIEVGEAQVSSMDQQYLKRDERWTEGISKVVVNRMTLQMEIKGKGASAG